MEEIEDIGRKKKRKGSENKHMQRGKKASDELIKFIVSCLSNKLANR